MLLGITVWVNSIALLLALWLGLYLVKHNTRFPAAWLSALACWSTAGIFLNQLLALNPPAAPPPEARIWITHLILFWPHNVFELGWQGWLQGWLPAYALAFWYHATLSLRPGKFNQKRRAAALFGYAFMLVGIFLKARYQATWTNPVQSPYYSSSLSGFFVAFDAIGLAVFAILSLLNLNQAAAISLNARPSQYFRLVLIATLAAGASSLAGIVSNWLEIPIPQVWAASLLSFALVLGGIGLARYLAAADQARQPRASLIQRPDPDQPLERALRLLVNASGASWVIALRFNENGLHPAGSLNWQGDSLEEIFAGENSGRMPHNQLGLPDQGRASPPFEQAALILPLYQQENEQAGVLLAGAPTGQAEFSNSQLNAFQESMNIIAGLVGDRKDGRGNLIPGSRNLSPSNRERAEQIENITPRQVELALRNLHNYAYLADLPLAKLRLVESCSESMESGINIFTNRGKAISSVVVEAVQKLKPEQADPPDAPPRNWYPYLILHKAYLEGISNRVIMSQLYISEGTFNRTRRDAIESVARVLEEMEANLIDFP